MEQQGFPHEDELESRQAAALYPLGRALRTTFAADNHDTLGSDITGLMLELARIDPGATARGAPAPEPAPAGAPSAKVPLPEAQGARGWRAVLTRMLGRDRRAC